jgi:hypothetical protein
MQPAKRPWEALENAPAVAVRNHQFPIVILI